MVNIHKGKVDKLVLIVTYAPISLYNTNTNNFF